MISSMQIRLGPTEIKKRGGMNSGAAAKYDVMTNEDIAALPIGQITEKNAVCFLWVTVPLLPEGMAVLSAWGFKYKTMLTWRKVMSLGMGFWFRGQCEHLLLGVKGTPKAFRCQEINFHQSKAGAHSSKPEHFRELISRATEKTLPGEQKTGIVRPGRV